MAEKKTKVQEKEGITKEVALQSMSVISRALDVAQSKGALNRHDVPVYNNAEVVLREIVNSWCDGVTCKG